MVSETQCQRRRLLRVTGVLPLLYASPLTIGSQTIRSSSSMSAFVPEWHISTYQQALASLAGLAEGSSEWLKRHVTVLDWLWPAMLTVAHSEKRHIDRDLLARLLHRHGVEQFVREYAGTTAAASARAYLASMPAAARNEHSAIDGVPLAQDTIEDPIFAGYFLYKTSATAKLALGIDGWEGPDDPEFAELIGKHSGRAV